MPHLRLRLKMVAAVDFRMGVPTHIDALRKSRQWPELAIDEAVMLLSQTGLQLAFVFPESKVETRDGLGARRFTHVRVQLDRHTPWHPKMLQNYARSVGIELAGHRAFEEWYREEHGVVPASARHLTAVKAA